MPYNSDAGNKCLVFLVLLLLEDFVFEDADSIFTQCPRLRENFSHSQLTEDMSQGLSESSLVVADRFSFFRLFFVVFLAGSIFGWLVVLVDICNGGDHLIIDVNCNLCLHFLKIWLLF